MRTKVAWGSAFTLVLLATTGCTSGGSMGKGWFSSAPAGTNAQLAESSNPVTRLAHAMHEKMTKANDKPPVQPPDAATSLASTPKSLSPAFYVSVALVHEHSGNLDAAREQYEKALAIDSNYLDAELGIARMHDRRSEFDEALKLYEHAATTHPTSASALNDLGMCYARAGQLEPSNTALHKAVALEPEKRLYRDNLATVLLEQGRTDEAVAELTRAHDAAVAHYNVGYLLNKRGKKAAALEQFSLAVAAKPDFAEAKQWADQLTQELGGAPQARMAEAPRGQRSSYNGPAAQNGTAYGPSSELPPEQPLPGNGARPAYDAGSANEPPAGSPQVRGVSYQQPVDAPANVVVAQQTSPEAPQASCAVVEPPVAVEATVAQAPAVEAAPFTPSRY